MNRLTGAFLVVALVALFGGVVTGLFQALEHAGWNLYPWLVPVVQSYYHGLSLHGVLNVLVWTTFFICGFLQFITARALGTPLASPLLGWVAFWVMTGGLGLAAIPLLGNAATVLFTFYPPMRAHWAFYVGLTLVVAGTWLVTLNLALTYRTWRARNPGARTPLAAFMSLVTFVMWTMASVGLAAEMLFMSSISGSCRPTSPGTPWCRARRGVGSSATRWRARRSFCFSSSRPPSASTTSSPIRGSRRGGNSSTPSSPSRSSSRAS